MKKIEYYIDRLINYKFYRKQKDFINEKMQEYAMNIDGFDIGEIVIHKDGRKCVITNKSLNSIEIYLTRTNKEGIDCKQWYTMKLFNRTFRK